MNILMSFGFWGSRPLDEQLAEMFGDRDGWPLVMVDSGAIQARNLGQEITAEGYAEWLHESSGWDTALNLDVIFDPVASATNHARLVELGVDTLPVFHGGEPWRYLEQMADEHPYLALGGMVTAGQGAGTLPWLARCFKLTEGKADVHGLGMTRLDPMFKAPWRSVDSSSWGSGHRYGVVSVWTGRDLLRARRDDRRYPTLLRLVRDAGFDPDEVAADYKYAAEVNAYAWLKMERAMQVHRPDFRLHLVDGAPFALQAVQRAWHRLEGETV